jgi:hypothetical protein
MKILWLSQHPPLPRQLEELKRLFGDVEVSQDVSPFQNAEEIAQRFKEGDYDDLVVVAPLSVIARLTELGIKPLWAEMQQVRGRSEADLSFRGRFYRFDRFRRIKSVKLEFEEIETHQIETHQNGRD